MVKAKSSLWIALSLTIGLLVGAGTTAAIMRDTDGATGGATTSTSTTSAPVTLSSTGRITSPSTGAVVKTEEIATGTTQGVGEGRRVWVLVEIGRYYPQDGPLPLLPDGRWSASIFIGSPNDAGKIFILHVVETGPAATAQFGTYLNTGRNSGNFAGIQREQLAPDVRFLDSVTVTRR